MSNPNRSFWSSVPGLVTGLAGLLTGVVGLITLAVQLDLVGRDTAKPPATTGPTLAGPSTTTGVASFTATPRTLDFAPTDPKEKTITIRNTSLTTELRLAAPLVTGKDEKQFTPGYGDCSAPVKPNLSCTMKVTFASGGGFRSYAAKLQLSAAGAVGMEVDLTASTLL